MRAALLRNIGDDALGIGVVDIEGRDTRTERGDLDHGRSADTARGASDENALAVE